MEIADKSASLKWYDVMYYRIVSETSETRHSLDYYDVQYLLNIYESINLKDYKEELRMKDMEIKRKEDELRNKTR